eukprot:509792-Prymnesium_polylepis.1
MGAYTGGGNPQPPPHADKSPEERRPCAPPRGGGQGAAGLGGPHPLCVAGVREGPAGRLFKSLDPAPHSQDLNHHHRLPSPPPDRYPPAPYRGGEMSLYSRVSNRALN